MLPAIVGRPAVLMFHVVFVAITVFSVLFVLTHVCVCVYLGGFIEHTAGWLW